MKLNRLAPITIPAIGFIAGIVGVTIEYNLPGSENISWILYLWTIFIASPAILLGIMIMAFDFLYPHFQRGITVGHFILILISGVAGFYLIPSSYII